MIRQWNANQSEVYHMQRDASSRNSSRWHGAGHGSIIALLAPVLVLFIGGCEQMVPKVDSTAEKAKIEQVVKNSIRWVLNKDKELSYSCFAQDSALFWFSPDNAGTLSGFESLKTLTEQVFMNPAFKGVRSEFKDLRITLSHSGGCAWWSCYLDDLNEWNGKPANWENVRWTGVLEKIEGDWKIRQMHFSYAVEDMQREIQKAVDSVKAGK
jgi:hypothetical protein